MKKTSRNDSKREKEKNPGFRRVRESEHAELVNEVFQSVADKYDLMNDLMSGGIHRFWKQALVNRIKPRTGGHFLDLAGGTGDVTIRFLDNLYKNNQKYLNSISITLCDPNESMLQVAHGKVVDKGHVKGIEFLNASAENLPLEDRSVDVCAISFGLRNVTDRKTGLSEIHRVLKFGGHFLCLEFTPVTLSTLAPLYKAYSDHVLPWLGHHIAGDRNSYEYLVESIRQFPSPDELTSELQIAGFRNITHRNLSGGIVAIHSGWRV
ncbi:MAG: bifunctional demethylmenaquinone methyltransferase/2-methoxy-6-polyprenyl-1,4-benzoquinol methylase UbiE [Pseudomonadota bacterium]|nr:bifunctional demethylmenaquinone methyltransferase/2-methoxy-6-polyprenyl-1,4-benzoquinol methylase UbiE [Pseudomonadota bacterium]